jgi:threonine dehydratase
VLRLIEQRPGDRPALVTASAGNHGRALAHAARAAGLPLTVYVPASAPRVKLDAIQRTGAALTRCADYDEAERRAKAHGATGQALFISPYSHPDVVAGAGTVGLEIMGDDPAIDVIVVPVGGGGLISGIAIAAAASAKPPSVIGVEAAASAPFTRALAEGRIVEIDVRPTVADGLAGNLDPDTITFDIVRELVTSIALVSEPDLKAAIAAIVTEERLIVEGAGAAAVAAVFAGRIDVQGRRAAIVLSGGNIDPSQLRDFM